MLPVINEPISERGQRVRMVLPSLWGCSGVIIERFELEGNLKGHQSNSPAMNRDTTALSVLRDPEMGLLWG